MFSLWIKNNKNFLNYSCFQKCWSIQCCQPREKRSLKLLGLRHDAQAVLVHASSQPRLFSVFSWPVLTQQLSVVTILFAVHLILCVLDLMLFSPVRTSFPDLFYLSNLNSLTETQFRCLLFLSLPNHAKVLISPLIGFYSFMCTLPWRLFVLRWFVCLSLQLGCVPLEFLLCTLSPSTVIGIESLNIFS